MIELKQKAPKTYKTPNTNMMSLGNIRYDRKNIVPITKDPKANNVVNGIWLIFFI
jgi:hypothetical protein